MVEKTLSSFLSVSSKSLDTTDHEARLRLLRQKLHNLFQSAYCVETRVSATLNELYPWLNYLVFLGAAQFGKGTCFLGLWAQRFLVKSKLKRKRKVKSVNLYIIQSIHLFMQNIGIWTFLSTQFLSMAEISKHTASLLDPTVTSPHLYITLRDH